MKCQGCGNPKDESEEYEMPADPATVASVDDPKLLEMAKAGENWRCAYCGSNQRDLDGGCAECGAGRKEGANAEADRRIAAADVEPELRQLRRPRFGLAHAALTAIVTVAIAIVACVVIGKKSSHDERQEWKSSEVLTATPLPPPRTDFTGMVIGNSWNRTIVVEQWHLTPHEGFTSDVPAGALEVRPAGVHFHHNEEVFDHDETIYEDVEVPDGFRTESYSERVSCGEDCTTTPRTCRKVCTRSSKSCRQVCKNKNNGFASCREECTGGDETCRDDCSGGDRRCTTKYCNQTKTRQVPKTRTERRPKVVKRYRTEARNAPWSTFKTWEWIPVRTVVAEGTDIDVGWPDAGVSLRDRDAGGAPPRPLAEREVRSGSTSMSIRTDDGAVHEYAVPEDEALLRRGSPVQVHIENGRVLRVVPLAPPAGPASEAGGEDERAH